MRLIAFLCFLALVGVSLLLALREPKPAPPLSVSHGPHEFVSVRKLVQCAEVYALTAMRLLS
jgi:acetylornithine deacetylase/succinyl-diaminopimelate desuccinylase-like protein